MNIAIAVRGMIAFHNDLSLYASWFVSDKFHQLFVFHPYIAIVNPFTLKCLIARGGLGTEELDKRRRVGISGVSTSVVKSKVILLRSTVCS